MNLNGEKVYIVEVGPRDGLQNESKTVPLEQKRQLVEGLIDSGLTHIECGSFVSPKWVPQMADSADLFQQLPDRDDLRLTALVPNDKGMDAAIAAGVKEIAVFTAASDAFTQKNINCSVAESVQRFTGIMRRAQDEGIRVRGYVSTVVGCPYAGAITPEQVLPVAQQLLDMGAYEVSLGDTIGVASPRHIEQLLDTLLATLPARQLAVHFHDTYGQALANVYQALQMGIRTVDSSVAGLGGCPYAKGASGNLATEDLVYMLNGLGCHHGVQLDKLIQTGQQISQFLGRQTASKVALALGQ